MKLLLESILLGFFSEMGDKTQWIALSIAMRSGRPRMIVGAIFVGSLCNHIIAAYLGDWLSFHVSGQVVSLIMATLFFLFALQMIWQSNEGNKLKNHPTLPDRFCRNFSSIAFLFFLVEIGDKTQVATLALAAKSSNLWLPALGTSIGTLLSDSLAVTLGAAVMKRIPEQVLRYTCAGLFLVFGIVWLSV